MNTKLVKVDGFYDVPERENNEIQSLVVIAQRWFDKAWGNTYHSCAVVLNGKEIGFIPFEYGYDEQYKNTALTILQNNGYFNSGEQCDNGYPKDSENFHNFCIGNRDRVLFYCTDVDRKRDLRKK